MVRRVFLGDTPLTPREIVLALLILAGLNPDEYPDREAKSLLYKARSFKESPQ